MSNNSLVVKLKSTLSNARELVGQDKFQECLELLKGMPPRNAPAESPLCYQLLALKGLASFKVGKHLKAERVLNRATTSHPHLPLAWKNLSDLYQFAHHSESSSSSSSSSTTLPSQPVGKLIRVLEHFIPLLIAKQKLKRATELSNLLSFSYANTGSLQKAAQTLANPQLFDPFATWPRLELLYAQIPDAPKLEALYHQVHHLPGLINLFWSTSRFHDLAATALSMFLTDHHPHWSALETLLILQDADPLAPPPSASLPLSLPLSPAASSALLRRLALLWPDRPLAWVHLLPDEEVSTIQEMLLNCPAAISQWLRVARLRLQAQQPRYCLSAIRHGVKSILRMSQPFSLQQPDHPLHCDAVDWQDLPPSAAQLSPPPSPAGLSFSRMLYAFRVVEADANADVPALRRVLDDPAAAGYTDLLVSAHRILGRLYLFPSSSPSPSPSASASPSVPSSQLDLAGASFSFVLAHHSPDDPEALAGMGWIAHLRADHAQAEAQLARAVQLAPSCAEYHYQLGQVLQALGRPDAAHRAHLMAAKLDPTKAKYFSTLGDHFLTQSREPHHAIRAFSKAVALDCLQAHAGITLAGLYESHGMKAEALQLFESTTRRSSQAKWAWIRLGESQLASNNLAAALTSFQVALRSNVPTEVCRCLRGLAETYFKQAKHIAALKVFHKILSLEPTDIYARFSVGLIHYMLGSYTKALQELHAASRLLAAPHASPLISYYSAKSLYKLSREHKRLGLSQAAQDVLRRAQSLLLEHPLDAYSIYHELLGDVYHDLNDFERALESYQRSAQLSGAIDHYRLGLVRLSQGETQLARQEFEAILKQYPGYPGWNALAVSVSDPAVRQHALLSACFPPFKVLPNFEEVTSRAWNNLGVLYLLHHSPQLAHKAFHVAQATHPVSTAPAWLGQGLIHLEQADHAAAAAAFRHALETEASWMGLMGVALTSYHLGDLKTAHRYAQYGLEAYPAHLRDQKALMRLLAHLTLRVGVSHAQAFQACLVFKEDDPSQFPLHPVLFQILNPEGDPPQITPASHAGIRVRDWAFLAEVALISNKVELARTFLQHATTCAASPAEQEEMSSVKLFQATVAASLRISESDALLQGISSPSPLLSGIRVLSALAKHGTSPDLGHLVTAVQQAAAESPKSPLLLRICWHAVEQVLSNHSGADVTSLVRGFHPGSELGLRESLSTISSHFPLLYASIALRLIDGNLILPKIFSDVVPRLQMYILQNPENDVAMITMAHVYYRYALYTQQLQHFGTALTFVESALALATTDSHQRETLLLMSSDCYRVCGRYDQALQAAKSIGKNNIFVLRQVARIMASQQKLDAAITLYKKALQDPPGGLSPDEIQTGHSFIWQELGYCYAHLNPPNFAAAEFCYRQATKSGRAHAVEVAGLRLALLYFQWKKNQESLQLLETLRCTNVLTRSFYHLLRAIVTASTPNKQWKTSIERVLHGMPELSPLITRLFPAYTCKSADK